MISVFILGEDSIWPSDEFTPQRLWQLYEQHGNVWVSCMSEMKKFDIDTICLVETHRTADINLLNYEVNS